MGYDPIDDAIEDDDLGPAIAARLGATSAPAVSGGGKIVPVVQQDGANPASAANAAQPPPGGYLGKLSEQFESSNLGPGTVSSGWLDAAHTKPDPGGVSYGSYQMATNRNRPQEFLAAEGSPWKAMFGDSVPGTPQFSAAWKAAAAADPDQFKAAQYAFMTRTHYNVQLAKLQDDQGIDFSNRSLALRNAIFSTATQHGPSTGIVDQAIDAVRDSGIDPTSSNSDGPIIQAIFKIRAAKSPTTAPRYRAEAQAALAMLPQPQ